MKETKISENNEREKNEFFGKAIVSYEMLGKIEDVKVSLWHIHSLADLLVCKYRELVDDKKMIEGGGFSSPILSIAEILTEKTEAALNSIEDIEGYGSKIFIRESKQ